MTEFEVKPFRIEKPKNGAISIALIGCSRSGKSTLMKHIYDRYFRKCVTVMCSMNSHAEIYKDLPSSVIVSSKYEPTIISDMYTINHRLGNKFEFLFMSDDYVDHTIKNDPEITRCLTLYRNTNINSLFSFQGRTLMNATGRMNVNIVCIFKQQTPMEWKNVIDEYLGMWLPMGLKMEEKIDFCKRATENHQFFCIDNLQGICYLTKLNIGNVGITDDIVMKKQLEKEEEEKKKKEMEARRRAKEIIAESK